MKFVARAGLAVLSSIPTPGWGRASKKALAVSVSRSKVKKTSTKNKNQTNKKTSKKLSSLKNLLKRLSQKSRYGRMYKNARKLSSERDQLNTQEKLKLAMLIAVDAFSSGSGSKQQATASVQKRPTNDDEMLKAVYKYAYEYYRNNSELSHLIMNSADLNNRTAHAYPLPYNRSRSDSNQAIKKIFNSIGEIFVDIWDADKMRRENRYNSVYDYLDYKSGGILEGTRLAFDGGAERSKKMFDSPYGFGNWLTNGSFDLVNGAFNPEDPLSKEHWLSSFGLAGTVAGGGAAAQALRVGRNTKSGTSSGATKEKKLENTQGENGSKDTSKVEIKYPLSSTNKKHINKHNIESIKQQSKYLSDSQLADKLESSFFNPKWSKDDINKYAEIAYNDLKSQGKTGNLTYEIGGEIINVFIHPDGQFGSVYGRHKFTVEDIRQMTK